jgi:putative DNA primase/helicase
MEAQAALHNDALLCLDEIREVDEREVGEIVYYLCNGRGKSRMAKNTTARAAVQFKLVYLSTGEHTLSEVMESAGRQAKGGQEARLIEIPADANSGYGMWEQLHEHARPAEFAEALKRLARAQYGTAIIPFLEQLAADPQTFADKAALIRGAFVKANVPRQSSGELSRAAYTFGLVAAAGELATRIGLTGWPKESHAAWKAAKTCFEAWLETRGTFGAIDVERGISAVRRFLQMHGASRFQSVRDPDAKIQNRAGWKEPEDGCTLYYVFPPVFESEVCRGFDAKAVMQEILKRGHGLRDKDNATRLQFSKKLPRDDSKTTARTRVYALKSTLLESEVLSDEESKTVGTVGTEDSI